MKLHILPIILFAIIANGCASTQSTAGLTKDERNARAAQRTAWTLFGITVATKLVDAGVSAGINAFSNGGNERKLPRTFEK